MPGAVTLHERGRSAEATIRNLAFSSDIGAVEQFSGMYRVYVTDASRPVGTFQIELFNTVDLSVAVIDIVTLPSDPAITVFASSDGITQVQATEVSRSGYRVSAWFPSMPVRYLTVQIAPTHPHNSPVVERMVRTSNLGIARLISTIFRSYSS